jgi:CheY-like chemotaxis protein
MQEVLHFYDRKASMVVFTLHNEPLDENKSWLNALLDEPHFNGLNVVVMHPTSETLRQPAIDGVVHLSIPIQITELRAKMEDIFGNTISGIGGITSGSQTKTPMIMPEKKTTLLVVEDNLINREMLIDYLLSKDFEIVTATNGLEAIEKAIEYRPDLILMDIQMPVMDGMEATRQIRANSNPQIAAIPILAVTALAMIGDRERILAAGCNDYVSKPIILPTLIDAIYKTIKNNLANAN